MASKPDRLGQKLNEIHTINERASDHIVIQLMRPYLNNGRNVTTDDYFASVRLATQLKEKKTSLLETVKKVRRKVLLSLKKMKEKLCSCKLYKSEAITLIT